MNIQGKNKSLKLYNKDMVDNKYTQQEVDSALNKLTRNLEKLTHQRGSLNEQMRSVKKNIKFYKELDFSQLKAF
tara:strand:+ start:1020 stop:1241 length:222 start_codon:yes stop_codon:yes gene_type:complete